MVPYLSIASVAQYHSVYTLNMDNRKPRREFSQEIRKEIVVKHVKDQFYKTISKQLNVPMTTVVHIIRTVKIHRTVANLDVAARGKLMTN